VILNGRSGRSNTVSRWARCPRGEDAEWCRNLGPGRVCSTNADNNSRDLPAAFNGPLGVGGHRAKRLNTSSTTQQDAGCKAGQLWGRTRALQERSAATPERCVCTGTLARGQSRRLPDVVQDACLCALRAIGTFSDGNARTWMLTIVRNTAYSWLHKNRPPLLYWSRTSRPSIAHRPSSCTLIRLRACSSPKTTRHYSRRQLRHCRHRTVKPSFYARSTSSATARSPQWPGRPSAR